MDKIVIRGNSSLKGEVPVSGAKNSALPIMAAALLAEDGTHLENIPNLRDVATMVKLLRALGAKVNYGNGLLEIKPGNNLKPIAP